jgi:hypothetical protein
MYHVDFPMGRKFLREDDIPEGCVTTPADIGYDTAGNKVDDAPFRNKGGRPRKYRELEE